MLFGPATLRAIGDGSVTVAFRRWLQPRVRPGGRQRTAVGVIVFEAIEEVDRREISDIDAHEAGYSTRDQLLAMVDRPVSGPVSGTIYRIRLRLAGPDPRVALRESLPDGDGLREIDHRLARLDRDSRHGPWTEAVLRAIDHEPGVRAADLAAGFDRERLAFKLDVRKLKELGLTESLPRGYRLSARGRAVLKMLDGMGGAR